MKRETSSPVGCCGGKSQSFHRTAKNDYFIPHVSLTFRLEQLGSH